VTLKLNLEGQQILQKKVSQMGKKNRFKDIIWGNDMF
jgi:hypothetical protein